MRTLRILTGFVCAALFSAAVVTDGCAQDAPSSADAPAAVSAACPGGYANNFRLGGLVTTPRGFTLADLQGRTTTKLNVAYVTGRSGLVSESYIGVPLYDLLTEAGIVVDPNQKNDILRKSIVVTATDCYQVTLSLAEILPNFGGQQVIIAFADGDGTPLAADEGMARLVVPGDKAGGRYVSNITRILVRQPSPAPQAAQ